MGPGERGGGPRRRPACGRERVEGPRRARRHRAPAARWGFGEAEEKGGGTREEVNEGIQGHGRGRRPAGKGGRRGGASGVGELGLRAGSRRPWRGRRTAASRERRRRRRGGGEQGGRPGDGAGAEHGGREPEGSRARRPRAGGAEHGGAARVLRPCVCVVRVRGGSREIEGNEGRLRARALRPCVCGVCAPGVDRGRVRWREKKENRVRHVTDPWLCVAGQSRVGVQCFKPGY